MPGCKADNRQLSQNMTGTLFHYRVKGKIRIYVIDKHGRERWLLDQDFTTAQMIGDLQTLLKE